MFTENHYVTLLVSLSDMGGSIALENFVHPCTLQDIFNFFFLWLKF